MFDASFVCHALEFCPRFSCSWDSDFKVMKDPAEAKHKVWTMKEYRILWQCFEISKLKGESGWKDRMESAWRGADMRDVSLRSLLSKLRDIKFGKLCLLERESIGRRVRSKYLCEDVIEECEEEAEEDDFSTLDNLEEEHSVSDRDDSMSVDLSFEEWIVQGNDEPLEDVLFNAGEVEESNVLKVDLELKVSAERTDVFAEGKSVKPLDEEAKDVLKRLREVFYSKAKESVPSLKTANHLDLKKQLRLVNGVAGNLAVVCQSISEVNQLMYACSLVIAERLGFKKKKSGGMKEKEEPWWKRRITKKVKDWRKDLSRIEELRRRNWKPSEAERKRLNDLYDLDCKGANEVCALLKSKIFSSSAKVKQYEEGKDPVSSKYPI